MTPSLRRRTPLLALHMEQSPCRRAHPLLSLSRDITIFANPERAFSEWFHPRERVPRFAG